MKYEEKKWRVEIWDSPRERERERERESERKEVIDTKVLGCDL